MGVCLRCGERREFQNSGQAQYRPPPTELALIRRAQAEERAIAGIIADELPR
ncbi:MAG TPA: hypothetical protein VNL15_06035 [Dehalococcoidia bacterium]|nr:hypothetical protein [Dehalococcoidia bacterium]